MNIAVGSRNADSSGLALKLLPETAVFRHDDEPGITACLTNLGTRTLHLVLPGDGSLQGLRTPVIEWTFTPDDDDINAYVWRRAHVFE